MGACPPMGNPGSATEYEYWSENLLASTLPVAIKSYIGDEDVEKNSLHHLMWLFVVF